MMIDTTQQIPLKDVPQGEFVRRKLDSKITYTRAEYDRSLKKYCLDDYADISRQVLLKGSTLVWVGFEY
jgi:hypothetical protein